MGQSVKKLIGLVLLFVILIVFLCVAYIFHTLNDAGDRVLNSLAPATKSLKIENREKELLEISSTLKKSDYYNFLLFSDALKSSKEIVNSLQEENQIKKIKNNFYIVNEDISLPKLLENHCKTPYCYQHKKSFSKIPSLFWKGLMGIEDYRFLDHIGIDPISIMRAIITDIKAMKLVQGGSTLTQQLVKNLYFTNKKTFTRKIKEIIIAVYIDSKYEKEDILESYFNEVFWGSYKGIRVKGISAASLIYFGKKLNRLSAFEVAILIGMLKGPIYYSPLRHLDRIKKRATVVFRKLRSLGLFSKSETVEWGRREFDSWKKWLHRPSGKLYLDTLWRVTKRSDKRLFNDYEKYIFTLNALKVEAEIKKKYKNKDISIKVFVKKVNSNSVKDQFVYYSKYERNQEVATTKERHQVGSTLKPILYYLFEKNGMFLDELVSTKKITLNLLSGDWAPRESHKVHVDQVTLLDALLQSLNRPVIRLASKLGFEKIEKQLMNYVPNLKSPLAEYPSQLLGAVELSLEELWNAYQKFITESCRQVIEQRPDRILLEDTLIYKISDPKLTTIKRVVSKSLSNMRFFGKTGTSNNGFDNWYVFFDGVYLGILWTGFEGPRNSEKLRLFGSTTSFRVYQNYLLGRGKQVNELNCNIFAKKVFKD